MGKNRRKIRQIMAGKKKISMVTCYDYSFASCLNKSDVDIILVGDSMANVCLGLSDTKEVSTSEMLNHTLAVAKGAPDKIIVADMPYAGCQKKTSRPQETAKKFIEAGADAVKVEWFRGCKKVIKNLINNDILVMGHIGLTPQTIHLLGGHKVQGKNKGSVDRLAKQAKQLQELGVFSIVLECMQQDAAKEITDILEIPTIGIGAGKYCDGQVLVLYDLLGLYPGKMKFVRRFSDLSVQIKDAVNSFNQEVKKETFPLEEESF
ncbi:MAG: 3-methyl-2-oxobutanoate hydroxymethyltransferase [Candidatus Omnitrophica bacterium]|nr:3-methyl-2-oxobutanoate hydroxymethyltransferase [Candidatus Omnitrophota bacterium]MCF7876840.1 3-methyl-2-oxobutanoate hydroxymethyltransferase [Candidatus Omnitrophota bacterium]MCF7877901.1 3-methyl-2-oxobutanoate hydroxymethyltransferase [Candidatus Omnitrophota bacterium]MCF7893089.1 3-methyl-2-oxobutanoate hydroxymethyltransferase [Candidatus Omnitrophota bacterium]